jgi:ribosomal protein S18 acetylase RimI-like enzyme
MKDVADLIEKCFSDSLDQDGKRYIQQMRNYAGWPGPFSWLQILPKWAGAPFIGYVWEQDGRLIGNVSLVPYRVSGQRNYMIANVAVDPEYRRQGIARSLTLHAIKHARKRRANRIWLNVRQGNQAAVQLYAGLGFLDRGRRTTWRASRHHNRNAHPADISIQPGKPADWPLLKMWLDRRYPADMTWHLQVNFDLLKPGFWATLKRTLSSTSLRQWSAIRDRQLKAGLAMQWNLTSSASNLFLAAPDYPDSSTITAIISHACRQAPKNQTITLEFPTGIKPSSRQIDEAIESAGFSAQQTLIWMELENG